VAKKQHRSRRPEERAKKEFEEEVLQIDRVTRVVKGGKRLRFRATVVIGDRKGRVGVGLGKANEVSESIKKAVSAAKKNLIQIPLVNDTIPFEIKEKFKAAKVLIMPARSGTGIIAGSAVRKIMDLGGVKNVLAKSLGCANRINLAKATINALKRMGEREIIIPEETKKKELSSGKPSTSASPSVETPGDRSEDKETPAGKKKETALRKETSKEKPKGDDKEKKAVVSEKEPHEKKPQEDSQD